MVSMHIRKQEETVSRVKNKFCMLSHMRDVFMQENMNKRVAHDPVFLKQFRCAGHYVIVVSSYNAV